MSFSYVQMYLLKCKIKDNVKISRESTATIATQQL